MLFDLAQHLAHISLRSPPTEILPVIYSDILFGILSDVLSDLLSGILSDISLEILCGRGPAGDPELGVRVRRETLRSSG